METNTKKQQAIEIFNQLNGHNKEVCSRKLLIQTFMAQIEGCTAAYASTMVQLLRNGTWLQKEEKVEAPVEEQSGS